MKASTRRAKTHCSWVLVEEIECGCGVYVLTASNADHGASLQHQARVVQNAF